MLIGGQKMTGMSQKSVMMNSVYLQMCVRTFMRGDL